MNQEVIPVERIDDTQFGDLIHMPRIYEANKTRVVNARAYTDGVLATLTGIDLMKVDGIEMEAKMTSVRELEILLAEAETEINAERKPHTQKMDAVKSLFTKLEADLKAMRAEAKALLTAWETEKLRRQRDAEAETQRLADKAEERIRIRTGVISSLNNDFSRAILAEILSLSNAFNAKSIEDLPGFGDALEGWIPEIATHVEGAIRNLGFHGPHHSFEEGAVIRDEAIADTIGELSSQWVTRVTEEKNRLIALIPSSIDELQEAATNQAAAAVMRAREQQNAADLTQQVAMEAESRQEVLQSNRQSETMTAVAEVAAKATPVVQMASGTSTKKKYKVSTHQGIVALLQSYIKHDLKNLTVDEVNAKFSFVRTACDKRLNQPNPETIQSPGLEVVEDVTTRRGKTA